ncbi:MAG: serine/threonine-protein kinase, partial [Candidatus Limnocylindria bacterium]
MKDMPSEERNRPESVTNAAAKREAPEGRLLADRYRLTLRIDEGGAGEVWQARDERLGRDVAIKILGTKADDAFRERFSDEARRAAAVLHPNVVTVFDEGRDGADAFMVMELVRGRTLRDVVADRGPLRPHEAARIVAQIAAALDAAHEAGVIHCDVKPANVIVDQQGTAKLTDFGIARAARGPREHELIGTARYIAPERIEGKAPTERSDIYSLGLVAYELLAGRPPNAEMETEDLLRVRLDGRAPSLRSARVGISDEIDGVVAKALARDPKDRHASAGAFARDLLAASEHDDATGVLAPPPRALKGATQRGLRIDATTLALLAIIGVLVATLAIFTSFQGRTPEVRPPASPGATAVAAGAPNVVGSKLSEA